MNREVNEALGVKSNGKSELISAQARELLNLRRLPAMLNIQQTAVLLGLAEHDIPVLINVGLLKPLGDPPPNAVKYFASIQVLELSRLCKIRNAVYEYWRGKNAAKSQPRCSRNVTRELAACRRFQYAACGCGQSRALRASTNDQSRLRRGENGTYEHAGNSIAVKCSCRGTGSHH